MRVPVPGRQVGGAGESAGGRVHDQGDRLKRVHCGVRVPFGAERVDPSDVESAVREEARGDRFQNRRNHEEIMIDSDKWEFQPITYSNQAIEL